MPSFSLKTFGVGDGWPSAERNHSSFLYRLGNQSILVDCGEPISRSYKASGLDYNTIDTILISHLHFDHVGGLFMLIQGFWLERRTKELRIYAPSDGIPLIRQLLQSACIFDEILPFRLTFHALKAGVSFSAGQVEVTPYPTTHLAYFRNRFQSKYPQGYEAFSFLIETGDLRIGHSADIGAIEDLDPLLAKPLDVLVCELAHVPPDELFRYLTTRSIERIIFIHLGRDGIENLDNLQRTAGQILGSRRLEWARDAEDFDFERKV